MYVWIYEKNCQKRFSMSYEWTEVNDQYFNKEDPMSSFNPKHSSKHIVILNHLRYNIHFYHSLIISSSNNIH